MIFHSLKVLLTTATYLGPETGHPDWVSSSVKANSGIIL
jgi:hypothetical protein